MLGKLPRQDHPETKQLHRYLPAGALPAAQPEVNLTSEITDWGMCMNDTIGDCTIAGVKHLIQLHTHLAGAGDEFDMTDADVLAGYETLSGYDPATGANDNGAVETNVLAYWKTSGFVNHKILGWATVPASDIELVKTALDVFEGLYLGVQLPAAAQQMPDGWTMPANRSDPSAQPGSWGGHCVTSGRYDAEHLYVVTWGKEIPVEWAFFIAYFDEVYVAVAEDMIGTTNEDAGGLNVQQLMVDLGAIVPCRKARFFSRIRGKHCR